MCMNRLETKHLLVFPQLLEAGWKTTKGSQLRIEQVIRHEYIIGRDKTFRPLICDFALVYRGEFLATVVATSEGDHLNHSLLKTKDYASCLSCRVAYATDGDVIHLVNMTTGKTHVADDFLAPDELWNIPFQHNIRG